MWVKSNPHEARVMKTPSGEGSLNPRKADCLEQACLPDLDVWADPGLPEVA